MMFTKEQIAERGFYTQHFEQGKQDNTLILNMGPQHPSTHGVLRVMLEIDGEYILRADPVLGYIHRMHEKMAEGKTYAQFITNMGRVDYLHALAWNWAFVGAVEKLGDTPPTPRAEYLRVITCELNRISSHLLWWGAYLLDLGAFTPILYAFDDREELLDILQDMTGSRLTYASFTFGGVVADMSDALKNRIIRFIARLRDRLPMYKSLVTDNFILLGRVEDIGHIPVDMAVRYGATGPVLRGSGVAYDLRRAEPYSVYPDLDFTIPTSPRTDALGRYLVRMQELEQSLNIVEQAVDQIPEGDIQAKMPKKPKVPAGEVYFAVEGARGKIGCYLQSDGGGSPYRVKLRAPSFSNLSLFAELSQGTLLADAVSILGSLDLVIPEIDR
jgi:NADH-quinone oxidoreductase subunit D